MFERASVVVKPSGLGVVTVKILDVAVSVPGVRFGRFSFPESTINVSDGAVGVAVIWVEVAIVMPALSWVVTTK